MNDKLYAFVLMPFEKSYDDVYKLGIKAACTELGLYCERVDEQIFTESILDRLYNQIIKADIIIADMTGRNPNVFYETGYAHAHSKKVILLTKDENDIPFDLKHYPHIIYGNSISNLKDELSKKLNWHIQNPSKIIMPSIEGFKYYFRGIELTEDVVIEIGRTNSNGVFSYNRNHDSYDFNFQLDIHNSTNKIIDIKQRLGIITPSIFDSDYAQKVKTIQLNASEYLHIYDSTGHPFFPYMWDSFSFLFSGDWNINYFNEKFILKIFSESEVKEINFSIELNRS